jgi:hypothetical protein
MRDGWEDLDHVAKVLRRIDQPLAKRTSSHEAENRL